MPATASVVRPQLRDRRRELAGREALILGERLDARDVLRRLCPRRVDDDEELAQRVLLE